MIKCKKDIVSKKLCLFLHIGYIVKNDRKGKINMKFCDILEDYCEIGGLRIVRILNFDSFYAVRNSGGVAETTVLYRLSAKELQKLKNNELKIEDLYQDELSWASMETLNSLFTDAEIERMIEKARKTGYFEKKRSNERRDG